MDRMNSNTAKRGMCGAVVVALLVAFSIGAAYAQGETTVVGTGVPAVDVPAVQYAVDNFDIVNLVGTFHFGDETTPPRDGIVITKNGVTLKGEGMDVTVIRGGGSGGYFRDHYGNLIPEVISVRANDIKMSDMTLKNGIGMTVACGNMTNFEATRVKVVDITITSEHTIGFNFHTCSGDLIVQDSKVSFHEPGWFQHAVNANVHTGNSHYKVLRNDFDIGGGQFGLPIQFGNFEPTTAGDTAVIKDNKIKNTGTSYPASITVSLTGDKIISGNVITHEQLDPWRVPFWSYAVAVVNPLANTQCVIEKNTIHADNAYAALRLGHLLFSPVPCNNAIVRNNIITGDCDFGIDVRGGNNAFKGNNLATLDAPITYYFGEDISGNEVRGYSGGCDAIVDLGTDNFITGCTPMKGANKPARSLQPSTWGQVKSLLK